MKTYKKTIVKKINEIFCDVCGKSCTKDQLGHEYSVLEANWGYSSNQDGKAYEIHLCENCFTITISFLRNQRSMYKEIPMNDPFNGKNWL